jgi:TP901 family phage tail tape measure protein
VPKKQGKEIGSLLVGIGVDLTDFEKKMNQFQKEFGQLGTQVQEAGQQIGMAFGGVSLAIGAGLGVAVKQAANFEQALSNIKAVSGATGKDMEKLQQLAMDMGASTKYSATEAANGIEELIKAGVSVEQILGGGLKGALSLASAGGIELAQAAEIASTALNAFRSEGLSVAQAADILAGAANASATSVEELQYGLSQVAAVAHGAGMSFEDTSTALAVLAQNGKKGSDAGTSLKTMLNTLQPSTKEQTALFKELGLMTENGSNAFFDANENLKSLDQIAGILQKSMSGLTSAQRQQALKTIFGSDAMAAANILFAEGEAGVKKMKKAMGNVTAEEVATEKSKNFNGQLEKLKGAFETLQISIGQNLLPLLTGMAESLEKIVNWFNSLNPVVKKFISIGLVFTFVLTGLVAIIGILVFSLGSLAVVEWAVLWPILLIIAAVVAIIAYYALLALAIKKLYDENETFRKIIDSVWSFIKLTVQTAIDAIVPVLKSLWETLKEGLKESWAIVKPIFKSIGDAILGVINYFSKGKTSVNTWKTVVQTVIKAIGLFINVQLKYYITIFKTSLQIITTYVKVTFYAIRATIKTVFGLIKLIIKNAWAIIKGIIDVALKLLKGDWSGAWESIKETVETVFNNVKDFVLGLKDTFMEAGKGIINAIKDGIKSAATGLYDSVKDVAGKVRDFFPFSPAKTGPLSDLHKMDFAGPIAQSIEASAPDVQARLNSLLTVPDINASATAGVEGGTTVVFQLDSKTIARKTYEHMGGVFRVRGAVT